VYQFLSLRTQGESEDSLAFLTKLFFAIASPDALCQLRDALAVVREQSFSALPRSSDTIAETVQALDRLDISAATNALLRRYHLLRLCDRRAELRTSYEKLGSERSFGDRINGQKHRSRRSSSRILDHLMNEAHPDLLCLGDEGREEKDDFTQKRKSLQNRLECGGNWHAMRQKFSSGMLALVPTGGRFNIQNQRRVGRHPCGNSL